MKVLILLLIFAAVVYASDAVPPPKVGGKREDQNPNVLSLKELSFGATNSRFMSNFFIGGGYSLGVSCRIDCASTIGGSPYFGQCASRYYYYAKKGSECLVAGNLDNSQAAKVEEYCVNRCGCRKLDNRPLTANRIRTAQGDNSARVPL
ncbi:hypothetical protein AKO1_012418 [Acrasis kona]|uniref:Uncharacterized protein n=1 Tax=Acrasis kona TaxID=1008807 RepID=A0AAW2YXF3_9EUKA